MPRHLHLDFETFSEAELKDVGAYRYAQDPSTEILCAAMALDDNPPSVWYKGMPHNALKLLDPFWHALEDPETLIYAHNAQFEIAICWAWVKKTWGIDPPAIERFRCTMSIAHRAALPGALDKLGEVLDLPTKKDNRGKALIKKFCVMQKPKAATLKKSALPARRIYPEDEPQAFAELLEYCKTDVVVERDVSRLLKYFDDPLNNRNYTLHEIINARGVAVNLSALRHAQRLIDDETELVGQRFRELTGFEHTQNAKFLAWLHDQGAHLDNLQAETIETFLDSLPEDLIGDVTQALEMKQSVAYVSIKKVATMLECAGPHDNRIRGMLAHHAATTGRSAGKLVQFQNMKRPAKHLAEEACKDKAWSEVAYQAICDGISRDDLEIQFGPVLEVISSCIRHFVQDV